MNKGQQKRERGSEVLRRAFPGARPLWEGEIENIGRIEAFALGKEVVIVQEYSQGDGWNVYVPVTQSGRVDDTMNALALHTGVDIAEGFSKWDANVHFYAIGLGYYGRGLTEDEALAELKKAGHRGDRILVYRCPPGTDFFTDGSFTHPQEAEFQPTIIRKKVKVGKRWTDAPVDQTV